MFIMKSNYSCFSCIFHSCNAVFSKLTSFTDMDFLSRIFCLCFLTVKTVQISYRKIPFLARINLFRLSNFISSSPKEISGECVSKQTFAQLTKESVMVKKKNAFSSGTNFKKKFKVEATKEKKLLANKRKRPNYFVAVQISNPYIHEAIRRIQDHIIAQNMQFNACMNSIPTLHITLMVMAITDTETHVRALKALQNVHEEYNDEMCKNPLRLEFSGLGHFKNRVLYAKLKENKSRKRLRDLAECVRKHFAACEIYTSDQREFNPHLTIAKIDFSRNQKILKKIEPSFYETFLNEYVGCETVAGIQLLSMTSPKNDASYYTGENLIFGLSMSGGSKETDLDDVNKKKEDIRKKIANLARKMFK